MASEGPGTTVPQARLLYRRARACPLPCAGLSNKRPWPLGCGRFSFRRRDRGGGTRSHARVACEGPRATIKKRFLNHRSFAAGVDGVERTPSRCRGEGTAFQRTTAAISASTVNILSAKTGVGILWCPRLFLCLQKSQCCDRLIPQETLSGLTRMPDSPAGTTVFVLRPL